MKNNDIIDDLSDLKELSLPFNVDDVVPQCHQCIRNQIKKYEKFVDKETDKTVGRKFVVPCRGIKIDVISPQEMLSNTDEQIAYLRAVRDVVEFAKLFIKLPGSRAWIARWYQEQVLRCTSRRKVLRIGRRCLVPDSMVLMADGTWKPIEQVEVGEHVASRNKKNQLISKKVTLKYNNGIKDVYKISISNGMSVTCTSNHPLMALETLETGRGVRKVWKSIEDGLSVGTKVVVAKHYDVWGHESNIELAGLLGYMLTDGYFGKIGQTPKFTNNNIDMINEVASFVKKLYGYDGTIRPKGNGYDFHITSGNKTPGNNKFIDFLEENNLRGSKANRKFLPDIINKFDKASQMILINRMFSGDGGVSIWKKRGKEKGEIFLVSASKKIVRQVQLILRKVGVESFISKDERDIDVLNRGKIIHSITWKLCITRANSIESFFEHVGLIYGKEEASQKLLDLQKLVVKRRRKGSIQFKYETIKSIEPVGQSQTYDIGLEDVSEHNFVTDGILVHNTGKTDSVCVEILYKLFTSENRKIFVTGPQKIHVEEIFTRIRGFIAANPFLQDSVLRDRSAPYYELEMHNGSRLRGVPAGAKGKKEGLAGRGQDADDIYCEEMDYIDEVALTNGILPILYTTPTTNLVGFSTPSGFKTPYYQLCEESPRYKEFHFTYKVLPWWREIEAEKGQFTEEGWKHEYLAEWGTAESGVYKPSYIDRALIDYTYDSVMYNPVWKYTIGTDWNEKYGTEIVVLGYNPFTNMFQVVESTHVERSEFTQLAGISKLLEMNRKWHPNFIYIDAGNGSTNYEILRKTAYDNSRRDGDRNIARLLNILKKYDAGASIEIRDPVTSEKKKTAAKPFMVNASVRLFEQNRIKISTHDHMLEKQLRNYIIDRITPTKTPVYGLADDKVGDHRLDAFNLAAVAFHLEFDSLHVRMTNTQVASVLDPRTLKDPTSPDKHEAKERISTPQERRLDGGFTKTFVEEQVFASVPARIDNGLNGIKTNRPGWAEDEEDKHIARFLQRRRGRQAIRRDRPSRTKF